MLNKKERADVAAAIAMLQKILQDEKDQPEPVDEKAEAEKSVFKFMSKEGRKLYEVLLEKYRDTEIKPAKNEFLRKAMFTCRVSGIGNFVRTLEARNLAIADYRQDGSRKYLQSFVLIDYTKKLSNADTNQ